MVMTGSFVSISAAGDRTGRIHMAEKILRQFHITLEQLILLKAVFMIFYHGDVMRHERISIVVHSR